MTRFQEQVIGNGLFGPKIAQIAQNSAERTLEH